MTLAMVVGSNININIYIYIYIIFSVGGAGVHVGHPVSSPERTRSRPNGVSA